MLDNLIQNSSLVLVFVFLVLGFVLLVKGADFFVDGSSSLAALFKISPIIIGLTVVAMGTSLPETAVSATASFSGNNELAISNAIGSNIFNMMVVIGICSLFAPIAVGKETINRDIPLSALCAILLAGLGFINLYLNNSLELSRISGIVLIICFVLYILLMIRLAYKDNANASDSDDEPKKMSLLKSLIYVVAGGVAIAVGGDVTVKVASRIATDFGMSQTLVGLTIVSIGTSLPELVTSIVAARKKELDLALGNAIGSNIFNILMVLGIASAISPIAVIKNNIIDIGILLLFTLVVWIFSKTKKQISKIEGCILLILYVAYFIYISIR